MQKILNSFHTKDLSWSSLLLLTLIIRMRGWIDGRGDHPVPVPRYGDHLRVNLGHAALLSYHVLVRGYVLVTALY